MTDIAKPTQRDREAAAKFVEWLRERELEWEDRTPFFVPSMPNAIRKGVWDSHDVVQAFVAHGSPMTEQATEEQSA